MMLFLHYENSQKYIDNGTVKMGKVIRITIWYLSKISKMANSQNNFIPILAD